MWVSWNKPTAAVVCAQDPGGGAEREVLNQIVRIAFFHSEETQLEKLSKKLHIEDQDMELEPGSFSGLLSGD